MKKGELVVRKIRNGTVIDHIPAGQALNVLKIIGVKGDSIIAIVMNVESKKIGKKDIVKIENKELSMDELNRIALIAPTATINIIREYEVVEKKKVTIPDKIINIFKCPNPNCITNQPREPIKPVFKLISRRPLIFMCEYCGTYIYRKDILAQFIS